MKTTATKWFCLVLAALMTMGTFVACADTDNGDDVVTGDTTATTEVETDPTQAALDALGTIDYGKRNFTVLYHDRFESEIVGVNETIDNSAGKSQIINDAVYERNSLLEDRCNLNFEYIGRDADSVNTMVTNEATSATGDFQMIDTGLRNTAVFMATNGYLYDFNRLDMDLEGEWWDSGTAEFVLQGGVYFMSGSLNFGDDDVTYVLIFNKEMRETYANSVANPYDTVRAGEWTLDYFNRIIQGISSESSGNGKWDENDTYGFVTTWEYGNTFFLGSDLRYIVYDEEAEFPMLYLADSGNMEKALNVLELSQSIYHDNNATFMSPPGSEAQGLAAFKEGRGMFYAEVASYLSTLNREMKGEYGIVPVPKYSKEQEFYRTWTHESGSTVSVPTTIPTEDRSVVGQVIMAYAMLSHQYVKPAYYDTVLTSQNIRDADSAEMMDKIFANRVYDMAFYFDLGFYDLFKYSVNDVNIPFASKYKGAASSYTKKMADILKTLQKAQAEG